ncbi:hypothetical protein 2 [Shuangao sobemo-like virus 3]|uniref:hypothetical protein 2 n=1 Tax=Shuangao sobemo-like virus 3 TaxID=1923476 RepID=UPI00090BF4B2|nr:hypothetical protein 2 [Shuangao sobemo-like virus 3]APG75743.1 hypothetical protein 2 [Shuangao sobemo-like virus 3]
MEEIYSPVVWNLPDNYLSYDSFVKVCYGLDFRSSPGVPYCYDYPTVGDWFHRKALDLSEQRLQILWLDVQDLINGKLDPILRYFIKREPHKKKKIAQKRWRLIASTPLNVQVLWHMLFDFQNDKEIEQVYSIPSKQGMSLVHGQWKFYKRQWKSKGFNFCVDAEAWDWTMPYWLILWDLDFRYRMGRGRKMDEWRLLALNLIQYMFEKPLVCLSDGSLYRQLLAGIMKSGCVNTISTNSHGQIMDHIIVCVRENLPIYPLPDACGDDKYQNEINAGSVEAFSKIGVKIKLMEKGHDFIGHDHSLESGPVPLYFDKHLFSYCIEKPEFLSEFLESMCFLYTHSEKFSFWYDLALKHNSRVKSRFYYKYMYDIPVA